ncbi:MAG: DNA polymerase III subunit gamma/tau [Candidatus Magasanikbacteria bacterium]
MSTLYRKYRPQVFGDIHDQEHIVKTITNEIAGNKIAHAYLFTGPRGVGKTTIARLLAKAVNCKDRKEGSFEPCNTCSSCTEIALGRNIDVIEIDAASHTGVDNVRENIIDNAQFKPTQSKYKIFIIDEVHMLSTSAFNALLKTIEEPPAHVLFILATTELQKLPATIISRCQRFAFKKISHEGMLKKLESICKQEKIKIEKSVLEKIINKSEGGMRDAESLLGQILTLNLKEISDEDIAAILPSSDLNSVLSFVEFIADQDSKSAIEHINKITDQGINLEQFTLDLIDILRQALIAQTGLDISNTINADKDTIAKIKKLSTKFLANKIIAMIDSVSIRKREIKQSPIPQLPLELFAVQFSVGENIVTNTTNTENKKSIVEIKQTEETKPKNIVESIKSAIGNFTHNSPPKSTLEEIKAKWNEITSGLSKQNPSLTFVLRNCTLASVDETGLNIAFQFAIHKEKAEEAKTKKNLEDEIEKVLGERIRITCSVQAVEVATTNDTELNNLATEFGGEIV